MRLTAMPLPFASLHEEMDRMLKNTRPQRARTQELDFDLYETDSSYELVIDLPGCRDEDIEVSIDASVLHLRANRPAEGAEEDPRKMLRRRRELALDETIRFPVEIDGDAVTATFDRGELRLVLPKQQSQLPRKIEIKRG